jgi:hypothetical protein
MATDRKTQARPAQHAARSDTSKHADQPAANHLQPEPKKAEEPKVDHLVCVRDLVNQIQSPPAAKSLADQILVHLDVYDAEKKENKRA